MNIIQVENISKHFGEFKAVDNVSFAIEKGSVYGLLGPNGAGKTTTIRMIMAIIAPDAGRITFSGNQQSGDFADQIGYLPEERGTLSKNEGERCNTLYGRIKRDEPCRRFY